jgi:hypothetical protein
MPKSKEGTLRLAMNNYLKLPYIYTLESSFCGDEGSNVNYSIDDLNNIGDKLVEGICIYLSTEIASSKDNITNTTAYSLLDEMKAQKDKLMMIWAWVPSMIMVPKVHHPKVAIAKTTSSK